MPYQAQLQSNVLVDLGRPARHRVQGPQEPDTLFNDGAGVRRGQGHSSPAAFSDLLKQSLVTEVRSVDPAHQGAVADEPEQPLENLGPFSGRQVAERQRLAEEPQRQNLCRDFGGVLSDLDDPEQEVDPGGAAEHLAHRRLVGDGPKEAQAGPFLELIPGQ